MERPPLMTITLKNKRVVEISQPAVYAGKFTSDQLNELVADFNKEHNTNISFVDQIK